MENKLVEFLVECYDDESEPIDYEHYALMGLKPPPIVSQFKPTLINIAFIEMVTPLPLERLFLIELNSGKVVTCMGDVKNYFKGTDFKA